MKFEWDTKKESANRRKHGFSFDEAATVFVDPLALTGSDPDHSDDENRYITFGVTSLGRLLAVSHTSRTGAIRIIFARKTTRGERKLYEEA
jgi:uncharacterized DUF497 family protein